MKTQRIISGTVIAVLIALAFCACASLGRVAKSGNPELIYSTAIKQYNAEKWSKAASLFDACLGYYIGSAREDSIAFFSARSKFKHRDYGEAAAGLDEFRRKFGRSLFIEDADAMYAMCQYYLSPGPTRDQVISAKAIVAFGEFIERYPSSPRNEYFRSLIDELTQRLHDKNFLNAYTYFKIRRYKSAVVAFKNALKNYANTPHREEIMYYIVASHHNLAYHSVQAKQLDRYMDMLDAYYTFIEEFPESQYRKEVDAYAKRAKNYIDAHKKD